MKTLKRYLALSLLSLVCLNARAELEQQHRADQEARHENEIRRYQKEISLKNIKGVILDTEYTGPQWDISRIVTAHDEDCYSPRYAKRSRLCTAQAYLDLHASLNKLPENPDRKDLKNCVQNDEPLAKWPQYLRKKLLNMGVLDDLAACDAQGQLAHKLSEQASTILNHMIKNNNF